MTVPTRDELLERLVDALELVGRDPWAPAEVLDYAADLGLEAAR